MRDVIILLTCHEDTKCVIDNVNNYKRYMPGCMILINDSTGIFRDDKQCFSSYEDVIIIDNSMDRKGMNMIPTHIAFCDFMKKNNLTSKYVLMMASNQLFIKDGFLDYMKQYNGSYYERGLPRGLTEGEASKSKILKKFVDLIGIEHFKYHSNHDGMFFLYEDFIEMMDFLDEYRHITDHADFNVQEEFLYATFLVKKRDEKTLAQFKDYSYWSWNKAYRDLDDLNECFDRGLYMVKRVQRVYDDPVRSEIRRLGKY
jgi:hypothetical protein